MLCQLSYRGSLGRKSLAKLALDLVERVADLGEHALELDRAREVVAGQVRQLAPDEPLLEAQEELAGDVGAEMLLLGDRARARRGRGRGPPPPSRCPRRDGPAGAGARGCRNGGRRAAGGSARPAPGDVEQAARSRRSSRSPASSSFGETIPSARACAARAPLRCRSEGRDGRPRSARRRRARASPRRRPSTSRTLPKASCFDGARSISSRDAVEQVADGRADPLLEAFGGVGRVEPGGKRHDAHIEAGAHRELHPAKRGRVARRVGVEAEIEVARQPPELLQLGLGERRPHRGDDRLQPAWCSARTSV